MRGKLHVSVNEDQAKERQTTDTVSFSEEKGAVLGGIPTHNTLLSRRVPYYLIYQGTSGSM